MFEIRKSLWIGGGLVLAHGVVLATLGSSAAGPVLSDLIQLSLGCVLVATSLQTSRKSSGWYRHFWHLHAAAFTLWCVAQALGTYQDVSPVTSSTLWVDNLLFCFWFVPLAMALFFDPGDRQEGFDWLLALDFCQGVLACVASYLYFFYLPRSESPTDLAHSVWAPYFAGYGVIVSGFLARSFLSTSPVMRPLFRRLGVLLALSGGADAYYYYGHRLGVTPGGWFDLLWSALLFGHLLLPASWDPVPEAREDSFQAHVSIQRFMAVQVFPLLLAVCTLAMSAKIARTHLNIATVLVVAWFVCFSLRLLITHYGLLTAKEALQREATHDGLTGLWGHKAILQILDRELLRAQRSGAAVSVIMADLDHFKAVNDSLGHAAGDEVLRLVAKELEGAVRPYDSVGRYGGEEFLVVAPDCSVEDIRLLAERIRLCIADTNISMNGVVVPVTISLGTASRASGNSRELLLAADQALYRAKIRGRNRVELEFGEASKGATSR